MRYYYSILLFTFSCSFKISFSQRSAYYDARYLKSQYDSLGSFRIEPSNRALFNFYFGKVSDDSVEKIIEKNPFLKDYYKSEQVQGLFGISVSKGFSSIGSLNVSNLADGIAGFLIKRGREELNVAFFSRFRKFLDENVECKTLFPVTTEFLKSIDAFRYAEFIQTLRESFYKDLSNLIISLNQLIDLPKYKQLLNSLPGVRLTIRSAKIVSELSQSDTGILPDSLIHRLAELGEWKEIDINLGNSWRLLDVISQSVRYIPQNQRMTDTVINNEIIKDTVFKQRVVGSSIIKDTVVNDYTHKKRVIKDTLIIDPETRRWIKLSDMNSLLKDTIALRIFFGLIYEKTRNIYFKINNDSISIQKFISDNSRQILSISNLVENFVTLANDVDRTIKDLKDKQKNGLLSSDDYYTYINKAINITEYGFTVANTIKEGIIDDDYIITARNANDLYRNIYTKNYNNAIMNAYNILDQIFNKLVKNSSLPDNLKKLGPASEVIEKILKYGNFMASVVKAESGEDVQNALEAAALPAGSYSIKQKSFVNVSINGYIGYAWDFNSVFKNVYARGVYAPVGINITTGSIKKHGLSVTGFVSLLDVGAVAAYRLENGTTETLKQEVRLESIFSPSALLFIEVGGYPLAIGGGWRRTPKLFYSNNTSFITILPKNVFNFSILIDIPIFTIVNKPFEKK